MSWKTFQRAARLNDSIFRGYRQRMRFFSFLSFWGGRDTPARSPELYIEKPDGTASIDGLKEQNDNLLVEPLPSVQSADLDRYVVGPLTSAELWSSGREDIDLDRGPWRRPEGYARAIGNNKVAWIKKHASPQINYYAFLKESELPDQALALLPKYLVPSDNHSEAVTNILWHPDLHLNNIFVNPTTCQITGIIDWQSTSIAPLFYQSCIPYNFDTLSEEEQTQMDQNLESERMHKFYEVMVYKHAPNHWEVLQQHRNIQLKRNPTWLVTGVWENRDLFFLQQSLITIVARWNTLPHPNGQGGSSCSWDVDPEDYEAAKANSAKFKEIFVGLAKDEEERELFDKLWPYQDQESR
ncbi:hypothetical protein AJ80_05495 [Polytolypa hystricis UAMH7299]|uniref:Altered inheritance of mitochondria protein 9, mitochondrial n=1 Tax=Polytolypa hystricis (strain UAMH7299) TaxID=1447883 RepID=A0A2B7Y3S5_POLH7|nr:hypothetical protein AJ80_05495 [Polytolypa hystricis UAMH7299]